MNGRTISQLHLLHPAVLKGDAQISSVHRHLGSTRAFVQGAPPNTERKDGPGARGVRFSQDAVGKLAPWSQDAVGAWPASISAGQGTIKERFNSNGLFRTSGRLPLGTARILSN